MNVTQGLWLYYKMYGKSVGYWIVETAHSPSATLSDRRNRLKRGNQGGGGVAISVSREWS